MKLLLSIRTARSQEYVIEFVKTLDKVRKPKKEREGPAPKPFTTQYAIDWGKQQNCHQHLVHADNFERTAPTKWKLIDRERYNHLTKRHHDLEGGVDAIFDAGDVRVGVQGAGKGERLVHRQRFENRGGIAKAQRRGLHIYYVEFVRGNKTPILVERWA